MPPEDDIMLVLPGGAIRRANGIEAITLSRGRIWHAVNMFTDMTYCGRDAFYANNSGEEWSDTPDEKKCRVCVKATRMETKDVES